MNSIQKRESKKPLEVNDIVSPRFAKRLNHGAVMHTQVVVISLDPFVLRTQDGNVTWDKGISKEDFHVVGR